MWFSCIFISGAVKLSIKSFRIPELFIEVPETATVGSLKVYANMYFFTFVWFSCVDIEVLTNYHFAL